MRTEYPRGQRPKPDIRYMAFAVIIGLLMVAALWQLNLYFDRINAVADEIITSPTSPAPPSPRFR